MNICTREASGKINAGAARLPARSLTTRMALLDRLTVHDLEALREALVRGSLPQDFLIKLRVLAGGDISHRFIEQNCQLFAALLVAVEEGSFSSVTPAERERILRVLAYVRKEEDAVPDRLVGGFADDQREILAATVELSGLIQAFKAWRLRHQVPMMWPDHEVARLHV
jgi:hypothetical protein